jgi:hypothetical protein
VVGGAGKCLRPDQSVEGLIYAGESWCLLVIAPGEGLTSLTSR